MKAMNKNDYSRYEGLIFDMDGTLIDTMPAHLEAWRQTAEFFDFPFEREWLHGLGGMPSFKIASELNRRFGLQLIPSEVSAFKMDAFVSLKNYGDIIDVTHRVVQAFLGKKKLAVGTGSQRQSAERLLKNSGLRSCFDVVVTASDVTRHKPEPETFLRAAELLGLSAQQCAVFEDTKLGLQAAHAAGMDCFMVEGDALVFYPVAAPLIDR